MKNKVLKKIIKCFIRMDIAIFIFIFLAFSSVIGTIVQQNQTSSVYENQYGLFWADIIQTLSFDKAYSASWYILFSCLLILSLFLCIIINGKFIFKQLLKTKNIKLKLKKVGYFATHIGVLGICIAAVVNSFFGFRANLDLIEGAVSQRALIYKSEDEKYVVKLPFIIKNASSEINHYSSNIVKDYITEIEILDPKTNKVLTQHSLKVNSPLFINSFGLYQSSFFENVNNVTFGLYSLYDKTNFDFTAKLGEKVKIGETNYSIKVLAFNKKTMLPKTNDNKRYQEQDFGYSIEYIIYEDDIMLGTFRSYKDYNDLLGIGFFDASGQLNFQTIPVGLNNDDKQMLSLFADMLNDDKIFKQRISDYVAELSTLEKIEYVSKLIHAQKVYAELKTRFVVNLKQVDYDVVSGLQVNYDPSAKIFFISSFLLCLGAMLMLYFKK